MKNYLNHLDQMYDPKSTKRKIEYFKYNFSDLLPNLNPKNISVLEIGPGKGESINFLNTQGIKNIDIVDNDKFILGYLKKKYKINKSFLTENLQTIDKKLGKYNLIIMIQVLEHIPTNQYKKVLQILCKHLAENGHIAIVVPNANNPLGMTERYGDLQHYNSFTEQSLKDLVNFSGIEKCDVLVRGFEIPPFSMINIIRIFFQKILHFILLILMIINGGIYFKTMTPNIMLVIKKTS